MPDNRDDVAATLGLDNPKSAWRKRILLAIGIAIVLTIVGYGTSVSKRQNAPEYVTSEVTENSFDVLVTATGTVEPTNLFEISSELSGTLADVQVDFNDTVTVGRVLATLDTTKLEAQLAVSKASLDAAIARVAMAEASLTEARESYQLSRSLEERGVTAHQAFVSKEAQFIRAGAELESAKAERSLAEANLDLQQAELEKACICSPVDGIVLNRSVDPGQIVASTLSAPVLFTVAEDLTEMELRVDIDEADIGKIRVSQSAEFSVDAYDDRRFLAEIVQVRFAPETVDGVVTYKAILTVDNTDLSLRPGMTATADITVANVKNAMVVPNAALRYAPPAETQDDDSSDDRSGLLGMLIPDGADLDVSPANDRTVWVLDTTGAREVAVTTGLSNGKVTEIMSGEIAVGDRMIVERING